MTNREIILSVIIVNYNVKHFLEQCLYSVIKASKHISTEIIIVDNNSIDGSPQFIKKKFPNIHLIENKKNVGFSKANNQAIQKAKGKYTLILNPDTVVEEDTFIKTINFMEAHPKAGSLGVKMIDGKGNYLPESKRSFPTLWVAFCKMSGLSKLFPKSKKFGKYHLSYLNNKNIHQVEVLAGAFMLIKSNLLKNLKGFDESFFMYGEDIDLSYRIIKAGYKNYYYPQTTIIHYKGESTKKNSLNYVKLFYKAMIIFTKKHFYGKKANFTILCIHIAIYLRASLSLIQRIIKKTFLPILDSLIIFLGYSFIIPLWEKIRFYEGYYPEFYLKIIIPSYILLWITAIYFSGGYKKPIHLFKINRGILWGTIAILLCYSLVEESYRFSRALILLGTLWTCFSFNFYRLLMNIFQRKKLQLTIKKQKNIAIAGQSQEIRRVKTLLQIINKNSNIVGFISTNNLLEGNYIIGYFDQIKEVVQLNKIDEIIFCSKDISSAKIINAMLNLSSLNINFKIAPPESSCIIGSNSSFSSGDIYLVQINSINKPVNKRKKRTVDIIFSIILFILSPLLIIFYNNKKQYYKNTWEVLIGEKSWVGYTKMNHKLSELPTIKPGIFTIGNPNTSEKNNYILNINYAKNYKIMVDINILIKNRKNIDKDRIKMSSKYLLR